MEEKKDFLNSTRHSLAMIFESITPFIKPKLDEDKDIYNWLVSYFDDVTVIDKESDSFRYPFAIHVELAFANKIEISIDMLDCIYKGTFEGNIEYKKYKPTFLEEAGTYYSQSVTGYKYHAEEFYPFVKAYSDCAECLYKSVIEDKSLKEALFFSMCYLYRNAIELSLKEILFEECSFSFQEALGYMNKKNIAYFIYGIKLRMKLYNIQMHQRMIIL